MHNVISCKQTIGRLQYANEINVNLPKGSITRCHTINSPIRRCFAVDAAEADDLLLLLQTQPHITSELFILGG